MKTTKDLLRDLRKYDGSVREQRKLMIKKQNEKGYTKAQKQAMRERTKDLVEDMELKYGGTGPVMTYEMATRGY